MFRIAARGCAGLFVVATMLAGRAAGMGGEAGVDGRVRRRSMHG